MHDRHQEFLSEAAARLERQQLRESLLRSAAVLTETAAELQRYAALVDEAWLPMRADSGAGIEGVSAAAAAILNIEAVAANLATFFANVCSSQQLFETAKKLKDLRTELGYPNHEAQ